MRHDLSHTELSVCICCLPRQRIPAIKVWQVFLGAVHNHNCYNLNTFLHGAEKKESHTVKTGATDPCSSSEKSFSSCLTLMEVSQTHIFQTHAHKSSRAHGSIMSGRLGCVDLHNHLDESPYTTARRGEEFLLLNRSSQQILDIFYINYTCASKEKKATTQE